MQLIARLGTETKAPTKVVQKPACGCDGPYCGRCAAPVHAGALKQATQLTAMTGIVLVWPG